MSRARTLFLSAATPAAVAIAEGKGPRDAEPHLLCPHLFVLFLLRAAPLSPWHHRDAASSVSRSLSLPLQGADGISEEQRQGAVASLAEVKSARESLLKALQADVSFCSLKRKVSAVKRGGTRLRPALMYLCAGCGGRGHEAAACMGCIGRIACASRAQRLFHSPESLPRPHAASATAAPAPVRRTKPRRWS